MKAPSHYFSIREANFIRENYLTHSDRQIADELGRKKSSIDNFRIRERLRKPEGWKRGCFTKGMTPWNKGKSGYMGANITSFKKGQSNKNARPVGTVFQRSDNGVSENFIKLSTNRQYPYGRYVWEQATGETLTSDEVIRFSDGNRLNCDFKNLIKVTRAENVRLNSNRAKGSQSLRKVWDIVKTYEAYGLKHHRIKFSSNRKKKVTQLVQSIPECTYFA